MRIIMQTSNAQTINTADAPKLDTHADRKAAVESYLKAGFQSLSDARNYVQGVITVLDHGFRSGDVEATKDLLTYVTKQLETWHGINQSRFLQFVNFHAIGFRVSFSKKKNRWVTTPVETDDEIGLGHAVNALWFEFEPPKSDSSEQKSNIEKIEKLLLAEFLANPDLTPKQILKQLGDVATKAHKAAERKNAKVVNIGEPKPVAKPEEM